MNLRLQTCQHACGEFMTLALFADLRYPKAQSHADHDEQSLEQPMAEGLAEFRYVRVHFHARNPTKVPDEDEAAKASIDLFPDVGIERDGSLQQE